MPELMASDVARWSEGELRGPDARADAIVSDSREAGPTTAFAAVGGGHSFIAAALDAGAPFVVAERMPEDPQGTVVIVDDVVPALGAVAARARERMTSLDVVAITGSTGKTLTKDLLRAAVEPSRRVHATPKSYNAELGVPLTILSTPDDTEVLVVEIAARHPGEIAELAAIVRPRIGVITGIGTSHIGEFGSREAIARTKSELVQSLPSDGVAVLPSTDDYLDLLSASTAARVVTVGAGGAVGFRADRIDEQGHTHGTVRLPEAEVAVVLPIPGRALMRNAAQALTAATLLGADPHQAARALALARPSSWRMELQRVDGRLVVNDAYNANPTSMASALRATREMAGARPAWAVLGQMAELGDTAEAEHVRMGALAASLGYTGIVCVGAEAGPIADGAVAAGAQAGTTVLRVGSLAEAVDEIVRRAEPDAVIVVKASRVAGLERLAALLEASTPKVG